MPMLERRFPATILISFASLAAVSFACGDSSGGMAADAAEGTDGGAAFDGGLHDTGPGLDASGEPDTGGQPDGGGGAEPDGGGFDSGGGSPDAGHMANRSPGCGTPQTPGVTHLSIMVGSQSRTYTLAIPQGYDANAVHPLVFGLHGLSGSGATLRTRGLKMEQAMNTSVFAYPDGLPQPQFQNQTGWNLDPNGSDFAFIDALLDHLESEFCVDENRVFAYGFSFGAMLSDSLGCYRSSKFRAVGPVEGTLYTFGPCTGSTAAVMVHTDDDQTVTIAMGRAARDHYLTANGCDPNMTIPVSPTPCVAYQNCAPDKPVVWCEIPTGGHNWSPQANPAIWGLFKTLQ
jgi:polyhydroxybutyrate depolymerase